MDTVSLANKTNIVYGITMTKKRNYSGSSFLISFSYHNIL